MFLTEVSVIVYIRLVSYCVGQYKDGWCLGRDIELLILLAVVRYYCILLFEVI